MDSWKSRWGVGQWAAYFENQALPVMRRSKLLMTQLESREGEMLSLIHICPASLFRYSDRLFLA